MFYTYSSHPVACAVADEVLAIMERERLVERSAEVGARLGASLKEELSGHPMVGDIRGTGMFWGIELVQDKATRTPFAPEKKVTNRVLRRVGAQQGCSFYPATRDGGEGGRRRDDDHAAVHHRRRRNRVHHRYRARGLDEVYPKL